MYKFLVLMVLAAYGAASAQEFRAGYAEANITPQVSVPMWGYGSSNRPDNVSTGVHDPLFANALVIEADGTRAAIVGMDLGRAPEELMVKRIRQAVEQSADIDYVVLNGSHTHHGPALEMLPGTSDNTDAYYERLESKLIGIIAEAADNLQKVNVGWSTAKSTWNRNRHTQFEPKPVDDDLLLLRFDREDGLPMALLVNFAGHPTVHPPQNNKFSADYVGVLKREVSEALGCGVVFMQGAAGDLQCEMDDSLWGKKDFSEPIGEGLASEVLAMNKKLKTHTPDSPSIVGHDEDFAFSARVDIHDPMFRAGIRQAYGEGMLNAVTQKYRDNVIRPHLTTILVNGELAIAGVSGEFFCDHSLYLKRNLRGMQLLFAGYCNGHDLYFPTIKGAAEGGYGADASVAWAAVGAGETMMNAALKQFYALRAELAE